MALASVEYQCSSYVDVISVISDKRSIFFQSDLIAVIPNKLAFTSLHNPHLKYYTLMGRNTMLVRPLFSSDLINLCANMIQINIGPKHFFKSATRDKIRADLQRT